MAAARSPERRVVSAHCGSLSVVDARYLGFVFRAAAIGLVARIFRRGASPLLCAPVAGEELVGAPAEQERVGALVGLVDRRHGLVVARPQGPAAALESVPAVLIRRAAVSLHHSIDGDLRHGRQFHAFVLSRGGLRRYDRAPRADLIGRAWFRAASL